MICFKNMFNDNLYFVHAAKCGSRTTLGWMVLMNELFLYEEKPHWFMPVPNKKDHAYSDIRRRVKKLSLPDNPEICFCIVRDPVKRFLSAYQNSHFMGYIKSVDQLINDWDNLMIEKPFLFQHFRSQTSFYGSNKFIYTHIFQHENMQEVKQFLEELSGKFLPDLKLQQSGKINTHSLTTKQEEWVRNKYREDYINEWR